MTVTLRTTAVFFLTFALLGTQAADARDDELKFPVAEAMQSDTFQNELGSDVQFYWGDQSHPPVDQKFGEFPTNKKTNAFNKSDQEACEWALLSALVSLRDRALREGGNAVVNIKSNYKNQEFVSDSKYECGAGAFVAGVALKGTVVRLAE
jgi:hypothetical protein